MTHTAAVGTKRGTGPPSPRGVTKLKVHLVGTREGVMRRWAESFDRASRRLRAAHAAKKAEVREMLRFIQHEWDPAVDRGESLLREYKATAEAAEQLQQHANTLAMKAAIVTYRLIADFIGNKVAGLITSLLRHVRIDWATLKLT